MSKIGDVERCPSHGQFTLTDEVRACPVCEWPGHDLVDPKRCCPPNGCLAPEDDTWSDIIKEVMSGEDAPSGHSITP